jgi:hypothetical protein
VLIFANDSIHFCPRFIHCFPQSQLSFKNLRLQLAKFGIINSIFSAKFHNSVTPSIEHYHINADSSTEAKEILKGALFW